MREDFSELRLPDSVLEALPPDRVALFDLVRSQTTDGMLHVIASCDYDHQTAAHYAELVRIRDGIDLDRPIAWIPNEVLSLFRWSEPAGKRDLLETAEFHIARAFCCCALRRVEDENENRFVLDDDSLAPLVNSALELGAPYTDLLARQITWSLSEMQPWDTHYLHHGFALLAVLCLASPPLCPEVVPVVQRWHLQAEREILPWHSEGTYSDAKSFQDLMYESISQSKWAALAQRMLDQEGISDEVRAYLLDVARPKPLAHRLHDAKTVAYAMRVVGANAGMSLKWIWRSFRRR